jgi:phage FluMu gp28-like protein
VAQAFTGPAGSKHVWWQRGKASDGASARPGQVAVWFNGQPNTQAAADAAAALVAEAYGFYGSDAEEELDAIPAKSGGKYLGLNLLAERMTVPPGDPRCTIVRGQWDDSFAYQPDEVRQFAVQGWVAAQLAPVLKGMNPLRRHVFGLDFARSAHLTVLVVLEEDEQLMHRPRLQLELRNCPFTAQDQVFAAVVAALPRFRGGAADAGGGRARNGSARGQGVNGQAPSGSGGQGGPTR